MPIDQPNQPANQSAQSAEYQDGGTERKSTGKPKTTIKKGNGTTARVCGKRNGCRPRSRNALYRLATEIKRRNPKATASEIWAHFSTVAELGADDVVIAHDSDTLTYRPDPGRFDTRTIKQDSFARRWRELSCSGLVP